MSKTHEQVEKERSERVRIRVIAERVYDRRMCPTAVPAADARAVAIVLADQLHHPSGAVDVLLGRKEPQ